MGIYRAITETYGRVFGYLPFSVFQFLIILFPLGLVGYIGYELYFIIRTKRLRRLCFPKFVKHRLRSKRTGKCVAVSWHIKKSATRFVANIAFMLGVIWFMFTLGAGLNYARVPFGDTIGLETRPSYSHELAALTEILVAQVNVLSPQMHRNEYGHMVISARGNMALSSEAREIFRNAGEKWPVLRGFVPHTKPILYSRFMSRLRIVGVFTPWTLEPHVNIDVMDYHIPVTMLHELAHFRGFMQEDEANFIAWIIGHHSGHPDFMYSAAMLALSYAAGQLHRADRDEHSRIMATLCRYAQIDRRANWEYWQQFEGPLADVSRAANDAYLRANRVQDGVQSYGRVVDWLLAYFRD